MTITEIKLKGFDNKLKDVDLNYPNCSCQKCPRMFFNLLSIASRQSGKTYTICQLIKHYEMNKMIDNDGILHKVRTIVISPTILANPIYKSLNSLDEEDIYDNYSDETLQDILDNIKQDRQETDDFKEYVKAYKIVEKTRKEDIPNLMKSNPEIFDILEVYEYEHYKNIPQPKYTEYPVIFCILDDILGTGGLNNKKNSVLINSIIKNRHLGICFCILLQSCKGIAKTIRLNSSVYHLGKFANKNMVLDSIYEECSNVLTLEEFEKLYTHATEERYGSLIIDCSSGTKRFLKGLSTELILDK